MDDIDYGSIKKPVNNVGSANIYKMGQDIEKPAELSYGIGDKVVHKKFGEGVVKSIVDVGRDYEVCIDFYDEGEKTLFAKFAKLEPL